MGAFSRLALRAREGIYEVRRFSLTLLTTAAVLIMSIFPIPVAALGSVQVKLACSDGTTTDLTVDAETLTALQEAVEAMTLYPADLNCTLSTTPITTPLLGSFGANVAQAASGTDFVVGGGKREVFCDTNIAINGHRQAGMTFAAWGVVNQTIPGDAACGFEGIMRTNVVCVAIVGDTAIVGAYIKTSTGIFLAASYDPGEYLDWYFVEGKNNTSPPPVYGNSPPLPATTCASTPTFNDTLQGRILVKEHS